ncbi:MAG: acetolactate synthase small subunit [Alphaproteobacteria bacterium]
MNAMKGPIEKRTLSLLVDSEAGVLARVVGMFSARGYNIESLNVTEIDANEKLARITIVTKGSPMILEQIKAQLSRIITVYLVKDLTVDCQSVERELAFVKIRGREATRNKSLEVAENFQARPIDLKEKAIIFEIVGTSEKIDRFIEEMTPLGVIEIGRTGPLAMEEGPRTLSYEEERHIVLNNTDEVID